jgi:hypothetical protein
MTLVPKQNPAFQTYENTQVGFKMSYPAGWTTKMKFPNVPEIFFYSPDYSNNSSPFDLYVYRHGNLFHPFVSIEGLKSIHRNFKLIESRTITLDDKLAQMRVFTYGPNFGRL